MTETTDTSNESVNSCAVSDYVWNDTPKSKGKRAWKNPATVGSARPGHIVRKTSGKSEKKCKEVEEHSCNSEVNSVCE